jgi:acyl-CoA reductase-like NAD-dependent aldehyde dehydrogenase
MAYALTAGAIACCRPQVIQPVVSKVQCDKIADCLTGALTAGIKVLTGGGKRSGTKGFYITPTILVDVPKDAWVWQNEVRFVSVRNL